MRCFLLATPINETEISTPTSQWMQTKGPEGGIVSTLFTTTRGDIYAGTSTNLYKLSDDKQEWRLVIAGRPTSLSLQDWIMSIGQHIAEWDDTLYITTDTEVLASTDQGETWTSLGAHPKGQPVGFVIADAVPGSEVDMTLNLASR